MTSDLQQILALAVVALAAAFVLWTILRGFFRTKSSSCGGSCNACSANKTSADVVPLNLK